MSERHELRTTDEIMRLWLTLSPEKRVLFLTDFKAWLEFGEGLLSKLGPAAPFVKSGFTWIDDGKSDVLAIRIKYPNGEEQEFSPTLE